MLTPAFTPSPWEVRYATDVVAPNAPEGSRHVADCDPYRLPIDHPRWAQESANAQLIAAAPDAYAANVQTVRALREQYSIPADASDDWIHDTLGSSLSLAFFAARDAVAKVEGR